MTHKYERFSKFQLIRNGRIVTLGDGDECPITFEVTVLIKRLVIGIWCGAQFEQIFYVSNLKRLYFSALKAQKPADANT